MEKSFGNMGGINHRTLYQEIIHIPLIIRVPNTNDGKRLQSIVESIDIFPTILHLLNIKPIEGLQGKDLFSERNSSYAIAERYYDNDVQRVIVTEKWKLIINYRKDGTHEYELYDAIQDHGELNNLVGKENYTVVVSELKDLVDAKFNYSITPLKNCTRSDDIKEDFY